jgi:hypothetical protein
MNLTPQELFLLINLVHKNNDELRDWKQEALPEDKSAFTSLIDSNNKIILKLESLL